MSDSGIEYADKDDIVGKIEYQKKYQQEYKKRYQAVTKKIKIEIREDEHFRLKELAKANNTPLSKMILEGYYASEKKIKIKSKIYNDIMVELARIGNNINQIALKLNIKKKIFIHNPKKEFEAMNESIIDLFNLLQKQKY